MKSFKKLSFSPLLAFLLLSLTIMFFFFVGRRKTGAYHPFWVWLAQKMFKISGWELEGPPAGYPKFVAIGAPHTSSWDFPVTIGIITALNLHFSWMGKDSLFKGSLRPIFKAMGGIPIDRSKSHNVVEQAVEMFKERDELVMAIPAAGTRSGRDYWKSGFYYIALGAQIPIHFGYVDYKLKKAGIVPGIIPTGDVKADMDKIRAFYQGITPLHPAQKSRIRLRAEDESAS